MKDANNTDPELHKHIEHCKFLQSKEPYRVCECQATCDRSRRFECAIRYFVFLHGANPNWKCIYEHGDIRPNICDQCFRTLKRKLRENQWEFLISPEIAYQNLLRNVVRIVATWLIRNGYFDTDGGPGHHNLDFHKLVLAADTDPLAYDVAKALFYEYNVYRAPMPVRLHVAIDRLMNPACRPKLRGTHLLALHGRNWHLAGMVGRIAKTFHLGPLGAGDDGMKSACAAVAEGLRRLRLQPASYPAIRRIWKSRRRLNTPERIPEWLSELAAGKLR
ncbi:MAG: hypothetical protein KatS3mg118_3008 [Paracoccaceae bacterium]|nr:MAG: hypothetical protein KatS3mg118_0772 [Paracoccaceae bacterium]GIX14667.1 MAG: hypothetical protein KatS3mg118_2626 [Paracoccaceae bacterium]GIX15049.1 MAG: hypothetical protein KatS3mg118_3008 [Paracoccaceae bacterium]